METERRDWGESSHELNKLYMSGFFSTVCAKRDLDEILFPEGDVKKKQQVRENFRTVVFKRDSNLCKVCSAPAVDAHHITDRTEMPNGGYVLENGISLCDKCHIQAEQFHITNGKSWTHEMHPSDLYKLIGSSKEKAIEASELL